MMNQLGLAGGPVRPPLAQVSPGDKEEVRGLLEKWREVLS